MNKFKVQKIVDALVNCVSPNQKNANLERGLNESNLKTNTSSSNSHANTSKYSHPLIGLM